MLLKEEKDKDTIVKIFAFFLSKTTEFSEIFRIFVT